MLWAQKKENPQREKQSVDEPDMTIGVPQAEPRIKISHSVPSGAQSPNSDSKNPFSAFRAAIVSLPSPFGFR